MPFTRGLNVHFLDGTNWRLNSRLVYESADGRRLIEVPRGFLTDFASIPRWLWSLVGEPSGPWAPAAVVHDYLYRRGVVPRAVADATFREAMGSLRCDPITCWLMWLALRIFGGRAYARGIRPRDPWGRRPRF